jgi:thiamine biosynthesis protein ThiS
MANQVEIFINGDARNVPEGESVLRLIESLGIEAARVAIELDRNILPRSDWAATLLHGGERLEIVHFVGGG